MPGGSRCPAKVERSGQLPPVPIVAIALTVKNETHDAIDSAAIVTLVDQSNAANADTRRSATGKLERAYADSPTAIGLTLERLGPTRIKAFSPSGLINALYYLARSDPKSWTAENVRAADSVLPVVAAQQLGPQATAELASVRKVVEAARRA